MPWWVLSFHCCRLVIYIFINNAKNEARAPLGTDELSVCVCVYKKDGFFYLAIHWRNRNFSSAVVVAKLSSASSSFLYRMSCQRFFVCIALAAWMGAVCRVCVCARCRPKPVNYWKKKESESKTYSHTQYWGGNKKSNPLYHTSEPSRKRTFCGPFLNSLRLDFGRDARARESAKERLARKSSPAFYFCVTLYFNNRLLRRSSKNYSSTLHAIYFWGPSHERWGKKFLLWSHRY
jgi:hypothetical protein